MQRATVRAIQGDITLLCVDAIVNAAHESLEVGGGVNGAIHRAAGRELLSACRALKGCREGKAKITPSGLLPCKYVIHTVGPIWAGGAYGEAKLLASCYQESLLLAAQWNVRSIAFPSLCTGVHGYEVKAAAKIAAATTLRFIANPSSVVEILFCCYSPEDLAAYAQALRESPTAV